MPGLPFGAAQQHDVPAELRCYDRIAGIEFIEADPSLPYPRSVAYRPAEGGAQMRVRANEPDIIDLEIPADQAKSYVESLADAGLFDLQRVYRPAQGTFTVAGLQWRLEVEFTREGSPKKPRPFRAEGEGVLPDGHEALVKALMAPARPALDAAASAADAADGEQ